MFTRRAALTAGAAVTGGLGASGLLVSALGGVASATDPGAGAVEKFVQRMPVPKVLRPTSVSATTDYYSMTMKEAAVEILPGRPTLARTFEGLLPGPVVRARTGRRTVITQTNRLSVPASVHLHGGHVPESSDGGPMDLLAPGGGRKTYTYPNDQPHANLWFHDHAHHMESESVFRGLSGFYQLTDDHEQSLGLPSGPYDVPLAVRDARFDDDGQFLYVMDDFDGRNTLLANGKAWPYFEVAARKYRFRILNSANMRLFVLGLSDGSSFQQIGSDGGLLPAPHTTTSVALTPGERADVVIDFGKYAVGTRVVLTNDPTAAPGGPADQVNEVLQFRVTRTAADAGRVPDVLRTLPAPPRPTVERTFTLSMDETGAGGPALINGVTYDHDRVDTEIAYGTTELWTVTNTNRFIPHNFHIHLVQFRVVERNGRPVVSGPESGLKDTVALMPGETVKLQATFTGYRGTYVYHCHIFDHAAMGMMANMKVV